MTNERDSALDPENKLSFNKALIDSLRIGKESKVYVIYDITNPDTDRFYDVVLELYEKATDGAVGTLELYFDKEKANSRYRQLIKSSFEKTLLSGELRSRGSWDMISYISEERFAGTNMRLRDSEGLVLIADELDDNDLDVLIRLSEDEGFPMPYDIKEIELAF